MMPVTSSFYVTLTSDPTKEFPDNTTTMFKNRLPMAIRLLAPGWKVGMTSITLPDSSELPSMLKKKTAPTARLCQLGWFVVLPHNVQYRSMVITKDDLTKRFGSRITPSLFLHAIVEMYQESKIEQAPPATKFKHADTENPRDQSGIIETSHTFQWTTEGDLLWDNTKTSPYMYQPRLNFTVSFAKEMGWLWHDGRGYHLGRNIEEIAINSQHAPGDLNQYKLALRRAGKSVTLGGRFWFVEEDELMWLSVGVKWKFLIPRTPKIIQHDQMLFVYSNLVQSSIYNDKVVNLLSEALYKKEDTGIAHFEPTTIRYLPLRTSILETVETHIEDSSGQKLYFQGTKTILNLHFTRDLLP